MTEWQKIRAFDKRIIEYEERRGSGFAGLSIQCIIANAIAFFLMWMPFKEIFWELEFYWVIFHGVLLFLGGYWRMRRLLVLSEDEKTVSWKEYLKYIPVDWNLYRRHRYQVLICYTGKIFFCFAVIQVIFQVLSGVWMGTEIALGGIGYAAAMCFGFILLPGIIFIWKWC